jgi:hypothetical protein
MKQPVIGKGFSPNTYMNSAATHARTRVLKSQKHSEIAELALRPVACSLRTAVRPRRRRFGRAVDSCSRRRTMGLQWCVGHDLEPLTGDCKEAI